MAKQQYRVTFSLVGVLPVFVETMLLDLGDDESIKKQVQQLVDDLGVLDHRKSPAQVARISAIIAVL